TISCEASADGPATPSPEQALRGTNPKQRRYRPNSEWRADQPQGGTRPTAGGQRAHRRVPRRAAARPARARARRFRATGHGGARRIRARRPDPPLHALSARAVEVLRPGGRGLGTRRQHARLAARRGRRTRLVAGRRTTSPRPRLTRRFTDGRAINRCAECVPLPAGGGLWRNRGRRRGAGARRATVVAAMAARARRRTGPRSMVVAGARIRLGTIALATRSRPRSGRYRVR